MPDRAIQAAKRRQAVGISGFLLLVAGDVSLAYHRVHADAVAYHRGEQAFARGDFTVALPHYERAHAGGLRAPPFDWHHATALMETGRSAEALPLLQGSSSSFAGHWARWVSSAPSRALPFVKWWEYTLSGTHYFVGWTFFVLCVCPIVYLFFGVPSFFAKPEIFLLVFSPYIAASLGMFIYSLGRRRYRAGEIFTALLLNNISFPVYMKASFLGLIGVRGSFGITPKGQSASMPLPTFWPQLGLALLSFAGLVWGLHQLYYVGETVAALAVNSFWCFYHLVILATTLYFNWPEVELESAPLE